MLDAHPAYESRVVLPAYPRYLDLAHRTTEGPAAAGGHAVLVQVQHSRVVERDTWTP